MNPTSVSMVADVGDLTVSRAGAVMTITFDRPEARNALGAGAMRELLSLLRDIGDAASAGSSEVRCLVVTGADGAFCAGADVSADGLGNRDRHWYWGMRTVSDVVLALHRLPVPTIAKVRGPAVGMGANLALCCDLVLAGRTARFGELFVRLGLSPDAGGSWLLPRLVGLQRAKELVFFGDVVDAAEAERIGLVNRVVPDEQLDALVDSWSARLALGPPIALAQAKAALNRAMSVTLEQALDDEAVAQTVNMYTADAREALRAHRHRRPPLFEGH